MPNEIISQYVSQAREKNIPDKTILDNLVSAGWPATEVSAALGTSNDLEIPIPVPKPPSTFQPDTTQAPQIENSMWDAFQNVLLFISLYVMATSIAMIIHNLINQYMPGVDDSSYSFGRSYDNFVLRGQLAALIVSFPLFSFFFLNSTRRALKNPAIRQLKSRKQLIYLTLIVTFVVMLINIIGVVFSLLGGNITLNFLLHFLTTVTISGIIFGYYVIQVQEDRKLHV